MDNYQKYAHEWNFSAEHLAQQSAYKWMCTNIIDYTTVLEIGCGTGHSTLSLLENKHSVIAVEKNIHCLRLAKERVQLNGYTICNSPDELKECSVFFLNIDAITDSSFFSNITFDIAICWNIGTALQNDDKIIYLQHMLKYGLSIEDIKASFESSYAELLIWNICRIAKHNNAAVNLIERRIKEITERTDPYYFRLKEEVGFSEMTLEHFHTKTVSQAGRVLSVKNEPINKKEIDIVLSSITYQ